jgi:hypothetical protein
MLNDIYHLLSNFFQISWEEIVSFEKSPLVLTSNFLKTVSATLEFLSNHPKIMYFLFFVMKEMELIISFNS